MISNSTIDRVKQLPILDVVSKFIEVKKDLACCPFHNENTPSFRVNTKRNRFKCFGCGEGGDGIAFVQKIENATFSQAIEKIAANHGISIEIDDKYSPEDRKKFQEKRDIAHDLLNYAHRFYRQSLADNKEVKAHLLDRLIDEDSIEENEIGFAPDDFQSLTAHFKSINQLDLAAEIGLVTKSDKTQSYYDTYRNRIIFPIHDHIGQIIGFGGRILGDGKPKYINPKESFIYSKSNHWYNLNEARKAIGAEKNVYVVEGYVDVIAMKREGFANTIASSGTAITEEMIKALKPYTSQISFMLDGDDAGQKKLRDYIHVTVKNGFIASICALSDGEDPDSLAKKLHLQKN